MRERTKEIKAHLRRLLYGRARARTIVTDILLAANLFIILASVINLFTDPGLGFVYVEVVFGVLFAVEYLVRFWISRHKGSFIFRLVNMLDILVIGSLLLGPVAPSLGVLRVLRTFQVLRAYQLGARFDTHNEFIHRNFEVVTGLINIIVFLVVMSSIMFLEQIGKNPDIETFVDALYFTISTVTTTGFGDVVAVGTVGRLLSIVTMLLGVTLFFQLLKSIFVSRQLYLVCTSCGHETHQPEAGFCARCGHKLKQRPHTERYRRHKDDF